MVVMIFLLVIYSVLFRKMTIALKFSITFLGRTNGILVEPAEFGMIVSFVVVSNKTTSPAEIVTVLYKATVW